MSGQLEAASASGVRLLLSAVTDQDVACIAADGTLATWSGTEQVAVRRGVLDEEAPRAEAAVAALCDSASADEEAASTAPEFVPEVGYRGHRRARAAHSRTQVLAANHCVLKF